jgi:hypothetical protein
MTPKWTIYEADPSGNACDIFETSDAFTALVRLEKFRMDSQTNGKSNRVYGVYDKDEPERGDAQMLLEEMLDEGVMSEQDQAMHDRAFGAARNVTTSPVAPAEDFDDSDPETRDEQVARMERDGQLDHACGMCQREYYARPDTMPADVFAPRHKASSRCQSGGRSHCTCDTCF